MWRSPFFQRDLLRFFRDHAERVNWYQAVLCGCGSSPGAPANIGCKVCGGLGYFYPSAAVTTLAILTAVKQQEVLESAGLVMPGDLVCDQPPGAVSLAPWDIIITTWSQGLPFEGSVLQRGNGTTDNLPYRATKAYECVQTDPLTGSVTTYTEGIDFSVSGKSVTWLGTANQPAEGTLYSVRYNATYEWVVLPPGQVRVERSQDLGPRTALRKRHVILPNAPALLES